MLRFLLFINACVIAMTLAAYLSASTAPATTWLFYFFGLAYPWFLLGNLGFMILWFLKKKRYWLYSLLTLLVGWSNIGKFWGTSLWSGAESAKNVKILTCNIGGGSAITEKMDLNQYRIELNSFLNEVKPDIICYQEHCVSDACIKEQYDKYPFLKSFYAAHPIAKSLTIFSKFPVINSGCVGLSTTYNDAIFADLNINGSMVRVYCVHLKSNSVSNRTTSLIENHVINKETAETSRFVLGVVKRTYSDRAIQAEILRKHIESSPYPVIIGGDFNDTPQTYTYATISENLLDAWQERGFGRGSTYAGAIPFLRIDFLLSDKKIPVVDCHVHRDFLFSDHYPVSGVFKVF
jgi:endonuclease/exonuclease/phosphatase family metal-dependent hydrolase